MELADVLEGEALYAASDSPEATLPGFLERLFARAEEIAAVRRHPQFKPLVVCTDAGGASAERAGVQWTTWQSFLLEGPPRARTIAPGPAKQR